MPGIFDVKPMQTENVAAKTMRLLQAQGQTPQQTGLNTAAVQFMKMQREENIRRNDYALNLLSNVNSAEDLQRAKEIFAVKYPQHSQYVDQLLPSYDPNTVRLIRDSLKDETVKLRESELEFKREELEYERGEKMTGFSPGTTIFQGGKMVHKVPKEPKKEWDLFEDEKGNQFYVQKGTKIPEGYHKIKAGPTSQVNISMPKAAPSSERESLNKLYEFQSQLGRIKTQFKPKYTGRFQGLLGEAKELTGIGTDEKESMFRQVVKDISDTLLRLRSGAQINEEEYKRLTKLVPTLNLPDDVFLARLDSLTEAINTSIKIRKSTLKESGFIAPTGETTIIRFDANGNRIEEQ